MGLESFAADSYAPYAGSVAEDKNKTDEAKNASDETTSKETPVEKTKGE